jgi:L-alanine-DL-glutamate epimerase-like enolase superfamily enzyme
LTIIRLETAVVEGDFDLAFTHVEIHETITDLGECFFCPWPIPILGSLELLLHGESPRDNHRLFRKLRLASTGAGSTGCIIYSAISGIEAALRGVLAQSLGVAIHRLLVITLSEVSSRLRAPIATGENLSLFEGFEEIMASYALSIVTPAFKNLGAWPSLRVLSSLRKCIRCPSHYATSAVPRVRCCRSVSARRYQIVLTASFLVPTFRSGMAWSTGYQSQ